MLQLSEADKDMWRAVTDLPDIRSCMNCGTCIAVCPASNAAPALQIRKLIRLVLYGLEDELLDEDTPWTCVTCSKCEEMCPMGVRPFEIGLAIRRWQCRNDETRIPPGTVELYKRGYTQPVDKAEGIRSSVGLGDALPAIGENPELLAKFQEMLMSVSIIKDNDYMYLG